LTIVGKAAMKERPGIHLAGNIARHDLFSLFDKSDVVLAPTRLDMLPGFVLEAMSRGVVPVLSDADSMNEIIKDGIAGYIVSTPEPAILARRICSLFEDSTLLARMGMAARKCVEASCTWDSVAQVMTNSLAANI
jgi:glycosyltransferase involved in cell wall biosynthesis